RRTRAGRGDRSGRHGAGVDGGARPILSTPGVIGRPRPSAREIDLLLVIYLAAILLSILYPVSFFSLGNLRAILNNLAVDGILAVGMMGLMIAGVFDLSVGSMMSMVGAVAGWLMARRGWPVPAAVAAGLALAVLGGLANGVLVARARVNALITTLGTLGVFQGVAILIAGPGVANLPAGFTALGRAEFVGVQMPVWLMLGLASLAYYLLGHTRPGRQLYYVGSNARAARLSGIAVERVQIAAFTAMG